jgi:hypothetical protein
MQFAIFHLKHSEIFTEHNPFYYFGAKSTQHVLQYDRIESNSELEIDSEGTFISISILMSD